MTPGDRGQFLKYVAEPPVKRRSDGNVRPAEQRRIDHAPPAEPRGLSRNGHCGGWKRLGLHLTYPLIIRYFGAWSWLVGGSDVIRSIEAARVYHGACCIGGMAARGRAQRPAMPVIGHLNSGSADAITNRRRASRHSLYLSSPTRWVKGSACGLRRR
jgi:hypothetical protein